MNNYSKVEKGLTAIKNKNLNSSAILNYQKLYINTYYKLSFLSCSFYYFIPYYFYKTSKKYLKISKFHIFLLIFDNSKRYFC